MIRQVGKVLLNTSRKEFSTIPETKRDRETKLVKQLKDALHPTFISVQDTTLGVNSCGSMYKIIVESPCFVEKSKVEQHKLVAQAIETELRNIHGYNLKTRVPPKLLDELEESKQKVKEE